MSYTVLSCVRAGRDIMPPYILYQATNLWGQWTKGGPPGARYQTSPSGWMESLQFFDWFKTMFVPHVATQPGHKLLIYDGHNSHISLAVVNCALANNISNVWDLSVKCK